MNHEQIKKDVLARLAMYAAKNNYEVTLDPLNISTLPGMSKWMLQLKKRNSAPPPKPKDDFSYIGKKLLYGGEEYELRRVPTWSKGRFEFACTTGSKKGRLYRMSRKVWEKRKHELY